MTKYILLACALFLSGPVFALITVTDDTGQQISLENSAQNVITLSPGLTELVYAAGGHAYINGVVSFSNYPEQAKTIKQIGRYNSLDVEAILSLQPDLIIAWKSGNPPHQIEQLKKLGLTVYMSEPRDFMDIPRTITTLGKLMATEAIATKTATEFSRDFNTLKQHYSKAQEKKRKSTFIQIWNNPVMSINQDHLISKVITLCGGNNIFAETHGLTNTPTIESILQKNPEVIIATGMANSAEVWLKRWHQWPFLEAVKKNNLYAVNPDHLVRHTPRILLGIKAVCENINRPE